MPDRPTFVGDVSQLDTWLTDLHCEDYYPDTQDTDEIERRIGEVPTADDRSRDGAQTEQRPRREDPTGIDLAWFGPDRSGSGETVEAGPAVNRDGDPEPGETVGSADGGCLALHDSSSTVDTTGLNN